MVAKKKNPKITAAKVGKTPEKMTRAGTASEQAALPAPVAAMDQAGSIARHHPHSRPLFVL
jgi:hypothetical protein